MSRDMCAPVLEFYEAQYALQFFWSIAALFDSSKQVDVDAIDLANSLFKTFRLNLYAAVIDGHCEIVQGSFGDRRLLYELTSALRPR